MSKTFCLVIAFLGFARPVYADQCLWNAKPVADTAVGILSKTKVVQSFCASCSEKTAKSVAVQRVEIAPADTPDMFIVKLNGDDLDLAYAFVPKPQDAKIWTNLGLLAKCDEAANFDNQDLPPGLAASP